MLLEYVPAVGPTVALETDAVVLRALTGTGIPMPRHQAVRTPLRDGESIVRTLLEPRYVIAHLTAVNGAWADFYALRRDLAAALNPKLGLGTLRYQPDPGGPTYEIGAHYEAGAGFGELRGRMEILAISFRCPDPAWRVAPAMSESLIVAAGGWVIPWSIPWSIGATAGQSAVNNTGDLVTFPVLTFTAGAGGAVDPSFENVTTGKRVAFSGLTLASFEALVLDMGAGTATVSGANVIGFRTEDSQTWGLEPGVNTVLVELGSGDGTTEIAYFRRLVGV